MSNDIPRKLLWVDLEMTGIDPSSQRIIEVAAIVTDFKFVELDRYEAVIHQPEPVLDKAEEWPKQNMAKLFDAVRSSNKNEGTVVDELEVFVQQHFRQEKAVLAGNSIHQDRRFIRQWWPRIEALLHYRMLDVSAYKIWLLGTGGDQYEKRESHRALDDIQESIAELKWSLDQIASRE